MDIEDAADVLDTKGMAELFGQTVGAFNTSKSRGEPQIPPKSFTVGKSSPRWLKSAVLKHLEKISSTKTKSSGRKRKVPKIRIS